MPVLQEVQEAVGYLPPEVQERIAVGLNIQGSEVFGVMSFYSMYTWKPKGKYVVRMCESPPCHISGAGNMLQALESELGVKVGETTPDGLFSLEKSACLGICEVAPAMQINGVVVGNLTPDKIKQVLGDYRNGKAADYRDLPYSTNDYRTYKQSPHEMVLLDNVGVIDPQKLDDYVAKGGYARAQKSGDHHDPGAGGGGSQDRGHPRPGRRRVPGRPEMVLHPAPGRHPQVRHLQRR